jgi:hypothetical protein
VSRSKLIRALLAAASLLGAVPLMGQASQASQVSTTAPAFPYGTYDSPLPADDNHAQPRTLRVELTPGWMKVFEEGNLIQTYAIGVNGRSVQLSRLSGACTDPEPIVGNYTWSFDHDVLTFAVVSDACPGRGEKLARTRLVRSAGASVAAMAGPVAGAQTGNSFPMGRYTLQAMDSTHQPPAGIVVEFAGTSVKVMNGAQLMETHQMSIDGTKWEIFELQGECLEPGDYIWHFTGAYLWMELVKDPCADRAGSITSVRFIPE